LNQTPPANVFPAAADKNIGAHMIRLTRLNRAPIVLNCDLIEHIDVTPDTVITLTNGQILRVRETADEVIGRIVDFRKQILCREPGEPHAHALEELPLEADEDPETVETVACPK
jgi:flagellar protein FlbD